MSIVRAYEVVERMIISEMIDILRYDGEETIDEWKKKREAQLAELNTFVITALGYNNRRVQESIKESVSQAEKAIADHIEDEWGFTNVEFDTQESIEKATDFLNQNIQRSLISVYPRTGTVEQLFNKVIDLVQQEQATDELEQVIHAILITELGKGLESGYVQSNNIRWRLDRYINEVEKHIFHDIYEEAIAKMLKKNGVELVKVFKYARPRDACVELQESGIICIVPREHASKEALKYPNIHDSQHMYLEPAGHHGIHCRHAWHHLDAEQNKASKLFRLLDKNLLNLEYKRIQFFRMVKNKLSGR